jgi:hypothetical protein
MITKVQELVKVLRPQFDDSIDRFRAFYHHGIMVEGWFKGELITALDMLLRTGEIQGFEREVRFERKRIDISVRLAGKTHWLELKHWLNGYQAGSFYGTSFYFADPSSVGITGDIEKLVNFAPRGCRWMFILAVCNPGVDEWKKGVDSFNTKFDIAKVVSRTNPSDFPSEYFLGLLEVI